MFVLSDQFYRMQLPGQSGLGPAVVLGLAPPIWAVCLDIIRFLKEYPRSLTAPEDGKNTVPGRVGIEAKGTWKALDFLLKQASLSFSSMVISTTLAYALKLPGREIPEHTQCLAQLLPHVHWSRGSLQLLSTNRWNNILIIRNLLYAELTMLRLCCDHVYEGFFNSSNNY